MTTTNTPALRFKEFDGEWVETNLFDIALDKKLNNGVFNDPKKVGKGYKLINVLDMYIDTAIDENKLKLLDLELNIFNKNKVVYGDIFFTRSSLVKEGIAHSNVYLGNNNDVTYDGHLIKLSPNLDLYNPIFLNYNLKTFSVRRQLVQGGKTATMTTIGQQEVGKTKVSYPPLEEQTKIANFLTVVDEKITELTQKHELLTEYKKGVMQQLFSQKIRFKKEDGSEFGDWEYVKLSSISDKNRTKNKDNSVKTVLTNSATKGIVKQEDYFDREIVTEKNLNTYYLVEKNDFVYNPRISVHAPVGPIKLNHLCVGVMSPLYTVFKIKNGVLGFFEKYFETNSWHLYVKSVANSGARHDRMNISDSDFFRMPIPLPSLEEQTKIAEFLSGLDEQISHTQTELDHAKTWKKGLLQKMFV